MSDEYQIEIPQTFVVLFVDPGRQKPNAPREVVAARYELCEDMASMLTDTAKNMQFSLGITERDVLARVQLGLAVSDEQNNVVTPSEAHWVLCRLAELLDWDQPVWAAPKNLSLLPVP